MTPSPPVRRAIRKHESQAWGGQRLQRILGARSEAGGPLAALHDLPPEDDAAASPFATLAYIDATETTPIQHSSGDLAIHVLWNAPADRALLSVGSQFEEPLEYPCAPGDFLLVPAGTSFAIGAGIVAVMIGTEIVVNGEAPDRKVVPPIAPTHGWPVFSRFNRQTFGVATRNLAVCRWKLTQPQTIVAPPDRSLWVSNLVEPVAVSWEGGMDLLGRTEGCFVAPGTRLTVTPNDLGYVLVAWKPDLEAEVLAPLRSAGYTNAEITTLGFDPRSI